MLLIFAALELVGFPIELAEEIKLFIEATIFTGVGFWGSIREWFAKGINVALTGNVITYAIAFFAGLFPFLAQYSDELSTGIWGLIEAIGSGNSTLIFTALFTVANIIWQIVQDQRNVPIPNA